MVYPAAASTVSSVLWLCTNYIMGIKTLVLGDPADLLMDNDVSGNVKKDILEPLHSIVSFNPMKIIK